ncbi:MAG: hypothetical protein HYX69_13055 [Planctomycetia bacterium]|nr:hypothetical protein [Planctomycetia bacterium]
MESQSTVTERIWRGAFLPLAVELAPLFVWLVIAVQSLAAVTILARRLAGAAQAGAAPGWLLAWVILAVVLAAAARAAWIVCQRRATGGAVEWLVLLLPLTALLTTAWALSESTAPKAVIALVWLIPMAEEALTLWVLGSRNAGSLTWRSPSGFRWPRRQDIPAGRLDKSGGLLEQSGAQQARGDCVRIERVQTADGNDVLSGVLAARFVPGQATAHVHVAFCPPFARVPRLEYRQVSGPAARIKLGQLLPHGARFDLKRTATDVTAARIVLEVRAAHDPGVE